MRVRNRIGLIAILLTALLMAGVGTSLSRSWQNMQTAAPPTFYRDVLPILQTNCQSCHRAAGIAPMPFETYEQTRQYAAAIKTVTQERSMPPWFAVPGIGKFSNDSSLTAKQIATLVEWADAKAPRGDPKDAPEARYWNESWSIPQPDEVLGMTQPVNLPAAGDVEYTYEIVPTGFHKDRWVQMAEILPALRGNVHHAVVYIRPPASNWLRDKPVNVPFPTSAIVNQDDRPVAHWSDIDILLVYAPGSSPDEWPATMGKKIPADSDLIFQMHYITNGKRGKDRTRIGLVFCKQPPAQRVLSLQLTNSHFVIPPGAPDYRVEARGTLPNDATLLSFFPHMHLRGKRFEYNIIRSAGEPDGQPVFEPLLRVNYHFHWQMSYRLAEPRFLKAGTELQAVAWYDNSHNNPHNPDPQAAVRWGEQTYEEMMVGFFDIAVDASVDKKSYFIRH